MEILSNVVLLNIGLTFVFIVSKPVEQNRNEDAGMNTWKIEKTTTPEMLPSGTMHAFPHEKKIVIVRTGTTER